MSKRGRQDDQESVAHAIEVLCGRQPTKGETEGVGLTPLEQQVVALKESLPPHVILMVACGYRVKFYGIDSRAVSRRVGIMCIPGQPFEYSSIPYTRVDLYVHRLVAMGYQVGFADQESAAMRASDGVKSGIFLRTISQLYSRATLLPSENVVTNGGGGSGSSNGGAAGSTETAETEGGEEAAAEAVVDAPTPANTVDAAELFLCFVMDRTKSPRAEEWGASTMAVTVVLVSFVTQRRRRFLVHTALEMEDILQRFDVAEVVVLAHEDNLRAQTTTIEARCMARCLTALPESIAAALHRSLPLHFGPTANGEEDRKTVTVSQYLCKTKGEREEEEVDVAITGYLIPFKLDRVYRLLCRRSPPASGKVPSTDMHTAPVEEDETDAVVRLPSFSLPGPTLRALDVLTSSVGPRGSMLGLLDSSITACGARCLRRWLVNPLRRLSGITARQKVIAYLIEGGDGGKVEELLRESARLGDAEAVLGKLHAERCHVLELARLLRMVRGVATLAAQLDNAVSEDSAVCPPLLRDLLQTVRGPAVTRLLTDNAALLGTTATTPLDFFSESSAGSGAVPETLVLHWTAKKAAETALEEELNQARRVLGLPGLEYRTIAGTAFLLDVPAAKANRAPAEWAVQTRTKANVRYQSPVIIDQQVALTAAMERLALAAAAAWRQRQREMVEDAAVMATLAGVVEALGTMDALHSLATTSRQTGYVQPQLCEIPDALMSTAHADMKATASLTIADGRHPMLDRLLPHGYVSCDVHLRVGGAWLLTGPNMGGKSALMRMVGCFVLLAQVGCWVPARAAVLPVFDGVFCRMGASDSILEGSSTFLSEMAETSRILRAAELSRSFVLMDELGRGTSSFDGAAVAAATLEFLLSARATTMFVTHYSYLCDPYIGPVGTLDEATEAQTGVSCYYMGFQVAPVKAEEEEGKKTEELVFTYRPCRGVTPSSFGVAVGRKAGLPTAVTDEARRLSAQVEEEHGMKQDCHVLRRFVQSAGR